MTMVHATTWIQFMRYIAVGLSANLLLYICYLVLTSIGMGHKTAMTLLYLSGVLLTFVANRVWSFSHGGLVHLAFGRYVIAYALGYLLNLALLWLAVDRMHLPHQGVQAVAIVLVAVSLFIMHKYWVFAPTTIGRGAG